MAVEYRRAGGRQWYEAGVQCAFAYPDFDSPQARLDFLRNPLFGGPHESETLPQAIQETPVGDILASSLATGTVRRFPLRWGNMPVGFPQAQRLHDGSLGTPTLIHATKAASATTDYLVSVGFRSFDGVAPSILEVQELNSVDTDIATHAFTVGTSDLVIWPQGTLRRLELSFTTLGTCAKLRFRAESTGQDFAVCDVHAMIAAGTDLFDEDEFVLDADADGVADGWTLITGSASDCSHYGQDGAGLQEWIRKVSEGALNSFEVRRPGPGNVATVRLESPIRDVGWPLGSAGNLAGVAVTLIEV